MYFKIMSISQLVQYSTGKNISKGTVRRVLHRCGYQGRVPRKRPFVSRKNRLLRLKFAKKYVNKGQEFWNKVIWSDETKINFFGSDGIHRNWRKANEDKNMLNILPIVKHESGSVML